MPLTIVSSKPQHDEYDVFLDIKPEVTFSHEIYENSLTTDSIRIFTYPSYNSEVSLTKVLSGRKITLIPDNDLSPDTQYVIYIKGDPNHDDDTLVGLTSTTGELLQGSQTIIFKTGQGESPDIDTDTNIGGYDPDSSSDGSSTISPDQNSTLIQNNDILDVINITPDEYDIVSSLDNITITFDQEIIEPVSIPDAIIITGDSIDPYDGLTVDPINVSGITYLNDNKVQIGTSGLISRNTEYTLTLPRSEWLGAKDELLLQDYTITFYGEFYPLYTTVAAIRHRGRGVIPIDVPDYVIKMYIADASKWLIFDVLGLPEIPTAINLSRAMIRIVTCWVIYHLGDDIIYSKLKGVKEKQLADLRIKYDSDNDDKALEPFKECIEKSMAEINPGLSRVKTGVKSGRTLGYPGRKRHINKYPRI